jgi:hypothetical protein
MKILQGSVLRVSLVAGTVLVVTGLPVQADVDAECRQEAEDYGIPPEQLDDYVTGCILSRGGNYPQEPAPEDYAEPDVTGETGEPGMEGGDIPE